MSTILHCVFRVAGIVVDVKVSLMLGGNSRSMLRFDKFITVLKYLPYAHVTGRIDAGTESTPLSEVPMNSIAVYDGSSGWPDIKRSEWMAITYTQWCLVVGHACLKYCCGTEDC